MANTTRVSDLNERLAVAQKQLASNMLSGSVAVGRILTEAKEVLPHGEFQNWLKDHFEGSARHANRLMEVAVEYPGDVPEISLREALKIIAIRKKPKPAAPEPPARDPTSNPKEARKEILAFLPVLEGTIGYVWDCVKVLDDPRALELATTAVASLVELAKHFQSKHGTKEWADVNVNIIDGCSHNCRYCFACQDARRYKRPVVWGGS